MAAVVLEAEVTPEVVVASEVEEMQEAEAVAVVEAAAEAAVEVASAVEWDLESRQWLCLIDSQGYLLPRGSKKHW